MRRLLITVSPLLVLVIPLFATACDGKKGACVTHMAGGGRGADFCTDGIPEGQCRSEPAMSTKTHYTDKDCRALGYVDGYKPGERP